MNELPFENIKREIITKKESNTSPEFKVNTSTNSLINYGIVNIDKPPGPTSHQISDFVKKILNLTKAGHSGTLDPHVTGILPIALGRATRIVEHLLHAGKEYIALMHLHKEMPEKNIKDIFKKYTGVIRQLPPIKSAVRRIIRSRTIYYLEILEIEDKDVLFKVGCEAGTYIRKLIHDMGQSLGCGAHMAELRRTKAGPFNEETRFTLHDLTDALYYHKEKGNDKFIRKIIQPIENAITQSKIWINDNAVEPLCHGTNLMIPGIAKFHSTINKHDTVAILTLKDELVCFGRALMTSEEINEKQKGIAINTGKVFMEPGTYFNQP